MKKLTKTDREEIYILLSKKYSLREIAKSLGRNVSTISREIKRNAVNNEYTPNKAQVKSYQRRKYCKIYLKKIIYNQKLEEFIQNSLKNNQWSPEAIAGRWNLENTEKVSHLTIYKYLYSVIGYHFSKYLKSKRKKSKKRTFLKTDRQLIPFRTWIDERPEYINLRENIGDFEGDTIVSRRGDKTSLLTLLDRKSRFLFIRKISNKKPKIVLDKLKRISKDFNINSITFDNGVEFRDHFKLNTKTYFCHPFSSWEKGSVEYANRLVRQFIPKKSLIKNYSYKFVANISQKLNNTPRKCLGYLTPYEVFILRKPLPQILPKCCD